MSHDFLWRVHKQTPARGQITIFNRSHYEDVLVVCVHNLVPGSVWRQRYNQINEFEELLAENGITILKFFLHISKDEQRERLQARLDDLTEHWKFNVEDLKERALRADGIESRQVTAIFEGWWRHARPVTDAALAAVKDRWALPEARATSGCPAAIAETSQQTFVQAAASQTDPPAQSPGSQRPDCRGQRSACRTGRRRVHCPPVLSPRYRGVVQANTGGIWCGAGRASGPGARVAGPGGAAGRAAG